VPENLPGCPKKLYACADILELPHKYFDLSHNLLVHPRKLICFPGNLFTAPETFCSCPEIIVFHAFLTFLGMPWCRDYTIDLLLVGFGTAGGVSKTVAVSGKGNR
jgi:hypothetical protein